MYKIWESAKHKEKAVAELQKKYPSMCVFPPSFLTPSALIFPLRSVSPSLLFLTPFFSAEVAHIKPPMDFGSVAKDAFAVTKNVTASTASAVVAATKSDKPAVCFALRPLHLRLHLQLHRVPLLCVAVAAR